jgi:hypothetical protein
MSFGFKGLIFKTTDSQTLKDNFIIYEKWQLDLNTNVIYICMGNADSHVRMLKKSHGISPQCRWGTRYGWQIQMYKQLQAANKRWFYSLAVWG